MENFSGLTPLGRAVLVKPYEIKKGEGKIVLPDSVQDRTRMMEDRAIVIEAGSQAWSDEKVPRAFPGDHVIIAKFAGYIAEGDDKELYRLVNERDIFCRITPKEAVSKTVRLMKEASSG